MKKKNLKLLALNKTKISELDEKTGGLYNTGNCITASGCSCFSCRPTACGYESIIVCPPQPTEQCTFITCPEPTGFDIP
ncbi:hypothetical protein [Kordia jejudonensis]|uniref:hypothetical protein n=1 Tax=Kordia jejudonensis TaxID=1348245 RepID=UPI0006297A88|nr:hypothetical protein [Kordia jejudonensis]